MIRAKNALNLRSKDDDRSGLIVVKDNYSDIDGVINEHGSMDRTENTYLKLFRKAGLELLHLKTHEYYIDDDLFDPKYFILRATI